MVPETMYLTVNIIDRYLELKEVKRPKLQLVGVAALLVSARQLFDNILLYFIINI